MFDQSAEVANTTREEKSSGAAERLSSSDHLDTGEGNSPATGEIQVLDRDTNHALTVRAAFDPLSAMADEWMERARLISVTSIEQVEDMAFARESRLGLRKVRSKIEHLRKSMKEDLVKRGKDIDGTAGALEDKILPVEAHLREQEEFAIRYERARIESLRASRSAELVALGADPSGLPMLGEQSNDGWLLILGGAKAAHEKRVEAARLAEVARVEEAQRIAAAKEAERLERAREDAERLERERLMAEENARLKAEAEERDRRDAIREEALRIEREAAAAIAKAKDDAARVERARIEADARKVKEENEAILRRFAEQEHRAKLEAAAEKERAEALAEEARLAPDRKKLERLSLDLQTIARGGQITIVIPVMATDAGRAALARILVNFGRLAASVVKEVGGL